MAADEVQQTGWKQTLEGEVENGRIVTPAHEDTPRLRRMTVFDAVVNHFAHKLRTVIWGWIGEALGTRAGGQVLLTGLER